MLPNVQTVTIYIIIGALIQLFGLYAGKLHKRTGIILEILAIISAAGYVFFSHSFPDSIIYLAFMSNGYFAATVLTSGRDKYEEVKNEISRLEPIEIKLSRNSRRIFADLAITSTVLAGAILFLIFGPDESPLKIFILFSLITVITEMIKRLAVYKSVKLYYCGNEHILYIHSQADSRKLPLRDVKSVQLESSVDLLKLHPLFTLFSSNSDFTTSDKEVIRIAFPGETVYLTVENSLYLKTLIENKQAEPIEISETVTVLPFYHYKNLKRLAGKLYFAITVKGISAYTGLLLIMYYLDVPEWLMVTATLVFWIFNLYISDRVLKTAMDAKETTNPAVAEAARKIFQKAGISNVRVYETESAEYNGMATGMNIGRSMITLTTETLKLPAAAVEGILAHEAVHVKKRDVLWGQLWRLPYMAAVLMVILFIREQLPNLDEYRLAVFFLIWLLIFLFPIYQSFCSQWMEVRADHLGASYLEGGAQQMAESLTALGTEQDKATNKQIEYSIAAKKDADKPISSLKRDGILWRLIEFQIMAHPPLYWRIQILKEIQSGWGKKVLWRWLKDRGKESIIP
ncbi:peptidase [Bacillus sp. V3-13]|uniref:M56 family metallopeptidase n=1 Tax=Bacillus sp. V3-13 TaxID=2053728 RepID=UPI000C77266F|nr:M56 family metallopeptidase [Bacillus sp. V3-13]PLR76882.1 peptidase [Bacillus sp. V3-13]